MYEGIELMGWIMFCMVVLVLGAEIAGMITAAFRRRHGGRPPIYLAGGFNLQPRESALRERHDHKTRTSGGSWGGLNKVE